MIAAAATVAGAVIGFGAQAWLLRAIRSLLTVDLPPASAWPLVMGFGTAVLMLIGFALPSMFQLARVPAIRILRRDTGPPRAVAIVAYGPAVLAVALLMAWVLRDAKLAFGFIGGLAVTLALLTGAGLLLVRIVSSLRGNVGVAWRYGLANLSRRRAESVAQIVAFGLGLTAMLLLAVIRGDLVKDWRASVAPTAPNFFFINIPPEEREAFRGYLEGEGATLTRMLPMVRGRMTQINGTPVADRKYPNGDEVNFAQREQNLSWSMELGDSNTIAAGEWFTPEDKGAAKISAAVEMRERLGLQLGDELTFDVAGETFTAKITSFRTVKWDSLQPNFFLMFPEGFLDGTAGTWLTSAHFDKVKPDTVAQLVRRFPASRCSTPRSCSSRCARSSTRPCSRCRACSDSRCSPASPCCSRPCRPRATNGASRARCCAPWGRAARRCGTASSSSSAPSASWPARSRRSSPPSPAGCSPRAC